MSTTAPRNFSETIQAALLAKTTDRIMTVLTVVACMVLIAFALQSRADAVSANTQPTTVTTVREVTVTPATDNVGALTMGASSASVAGVGVSHSDTTLLGN